MIDASKAFIKDGNKNRLRSRDIHKIVTTFNQNVGVESQNGVTPLSPDPRYARHVSLAEIAANDYNLNIPRYIDSSEPEDLHDLNAHLNGGIPDADIDALQPYWDCFPTLRSALFAPLRAGYAVLRGERHQIKATILDHAEFTAFSADTTTHYTRWIASLHQLREVKIGDNPKTIIHTLAESFIGRIVCIGRVYPP